jgi:hypothetical protein
MWSEETLTAVQFVLDDGIMQTRRHAIKPLTFVRLTCAHRLRLSDCDASTPLSSDAGSDLRCAGE